ncbi:MAG TPA: hypothetical protein VIW68_02810 [Candidatus Sulfotelmatobacter sp.]
MRRRLKVRAVITLAFCCIAACAWAQDSDSGGASLGDLARQTRAQKSSSATAPTKAQELANELQQEQEESENAPVGYKTYNAGDYRLFVPFPYEIEGRDENGTTLAGSRVGVTNTEVMVGNPVTLPAGLDENSERILISQATRMFSQSTGCGVIKLGDHRAYRCGLNRVWLQGKVVSGTMVFVIASGDAIPVMCVSPDDTNQCLTHDQWGDHTCGNQNPTWAEVQKTKSDINTRNQDMRTTAQVCEQVIYPSIQLREDYQKSLSAAVTAKSMDAGKAGVRKTAALGNTSGSQAVAKGDAATAAGPSLAEVVRVSKEAAANQPKARRTLDATDGGGVAPAGFKSWSFNYCRSLDFCWPASVFVPQAAVQTSPSYSAQYVFEVPFGPDRVLLYVGPAAIDWKNRPSNDPTLLAWAEMSADGSGSKSNVQAVTRDEATIAGKPGFLTHFEIKKNDVIWVGVRANVMSRGVDLMVGCLAPQKRFGDADEDCSTLIDSLRLP